LTLTINSFAIVYSLSPETTRRKLGAQTSCLPQPSWPRSSRQDVCARGPPSCEWLRKIVKWPTRASSFSASRNGQKLARRLQVSPRIDVLENVRTLWVEKCGRQVVRGPSSWPWCRLWEGCRSRADGVGPGSGRPRTRRSLKLIKRNLTSRFARLAKRCDRERLLGRRRHQSRFFGRDARDLFAISLDVNGTRKFLMPALAFAPRLT